MTDVLKEWVGGEIEFREGDSKYHVSREDYEQIQAVIKEEEE
jgi:hypothetical protein